MSWLHVIVFVSLHLNTQRGITRPDDYLPAGWGARTPLLLKRFPDLKRVSADRWCRSAGATTTCLQFLENRLILVEIQFKKRLNVLSYFMKEYGDEPTILRSLTTVHYSWSTPKYAIDLTQMADASGPLINSIPWTERITLRPPEIRALPLDAGVQGTGP
jgi:hypothetical protein